MTNQYSISLDILSKSFPDCQEIHKNIFLIKDFISEDERLSLISIAKNASEEDWKKTYLDNIKGNVNLSKIAKLAVDYPLMDNPLMDKALNHESDLSFLLRDRIRAAISKDLRIATFGTIQRHYPGSSLPAHTDKAFGTLPKYATVLYLNDDYLGGELYFPVLNLEFKFPKGSLVIFDTDDKYEHGVKEVLDGPTRFVITNFMFKKTD